MGDFKDNDKITSEDEAVEESQKRAKAILDKCGSGSDVMKNFFKLPCLEILVLVSTSFFAWSKSWRKAIIPHFINMKFFDVICDAGFYCAKLDVKMEPNINAKAARNIVFCLLCQISDSSQEACRLLLNRGGVTLLIDNISSPNSKGNLTEENFISINTSIIHNMAKLAESKQQFEAIGACEKIKQYFSWPSEKIQVSALSGVACLLGDSKAAAELLDENSIIPKLVECLKRALNSEDSYHDYLGFSVEELVESLVFLAVNDDNKKKIAQSGTLPLLVEMLRSGDNVEQGRAVDCLWALSFDEDIRKEIVSLDDALTLLEKVATPNKDEQLQVKARQALDYIKIGHEGLAQSAERKSSAAKKKEDGHIFISYCWKHQETALAVRKLLLDKGFKVWMDVDNMHSNTLESMAQGVENAFLVLICYSEYYKQSNMCRTEAEYVFRLSKPFIPVNMQYRFAPTGWLGIIIGVRLYVDFSFQKHPVEKVSQRLLDEIDVLLGAKKEIDKGESETRLTEASVGNHAGNGVCECCKMMEKVVTQLVANSSANEAFVPTVPGESYENIRKWKNTRVKSWLGSESLGHLNLPDFDGAAHLGLCEMKHSAPQVYYSSVLKIVADSFADCVRLTAALDKLLNRSSASVTN